MDDRTLLELAAKAYGLSQADHPFFFGGLTEKVPSVEGYGVRSWNPLTSDGDALRLAVKLGLTVSIDNSLGAETEAWKYEQQNIDAQEDHNDDPYEATRRAITRAAAAIGGQRK